MIYDISYSQVHNYDSKINTTSKWLCHQLFRFGLKTQNFREVEKVCIPCSVLKVFLKSKPALKTVLSNWGGGGKKNHQKKTKNKNKQKTVLYKRVRKLN